VFQVLLLYYVLVWLAWRGALKFPLVADQFSLLIISSVPASVEELQQEEGAVSWLVISPLGAVVAYRERN
jgi:hypothetical protein